MNISAILLIKSHKGSCAKCIKTLITHFFSYPQHDFIPSTIITIKSNSEQMLAERQETVEEKSDNKHLLSITMQCCVISNVCFWILVMIIFLMCKSACLKRSFIVESGHFVFEVTLYLLNPFIIPTLHQKDSFSFIF